MRQTLLVQVCTYRIWVLWPYINFTLLRYNENMTETLSTMLAVGKINSLGRTGEVVDIVLSDKSRLPELYNCIFENDEWLRMRAGDALEKVCRVQPDWFKSYLPKLFTEMAAIDQPSIQWHLAQMLGEIELTNVYQQKAYRLLCKNVSTTEVDWIVAANSMITLVQFVKSQRIDTKTVIKLLKIQQHHHSNAVRKKATKLLTELQNASVK